MPGRWISAWLEVATSVGSDACPPSGWNDENNSVLVASEAQGSRSDRLLLLLPRASPSAEDERGRIEAGASDESWR